MQLTVQREALMRPLAVAHRIVERRNTIPILSHLRLGADTGSLTIRSTDLDIEAASTCEADIQEPGVTTVPAHTLRDIVSKLPQGAELRLREDRGAGQLTLTSGRARFKLPTLPVEDYPDLQAGEMPHRFIIPVLDMARMVREISFAISTEETRYYLNGIYLHAPDGAERAEGLVGVATDGHRLARARLPRPHGAEGMPGVILPRKLVAEIGKLADGDGGPEFAVALSPTKIRITRDGTSLTSKLIDGTFPDYERVIPKDNPHTLAADGKALTTVLDRVTTISSGSSRAVKVALEDERIVLTQQNPDTGEATEEADAKFDGAAMQIGFNGKYLFDILTLLDSEHIEARFGDPGAPTLWRRRGDELLTVVLMPMRV
ncbi:DNA polymerase III subunit beta [Methylorubrum extorquens]|uniref:DNA polymerase III subunit beta n=1 Tax=Methylorubrum extorquens TaxID=408 RepID=UPI000972D66C|nr:DNA polymerase III subunit beta [Methylorubrum extorquens]APX83794.1 DNA polymerase III subunit beta [Methylorubrum extorquens]